MNPYEAPKVVETVRYRRYRRYRLPMEPADKAAIAIYGAFFVSMAVILLCEACHTVISLF